MNRFVCIHGHFYQPPRENPWLEWVELQDSAYPYHDWNERITAECYTHNTASRILNQEKKIRAIINNYSKMSFNFGPTLLSWMERHKPDVYHSILASDKESQKNFSGHGSALAQVYNHMIMPLANSRDKRTQILWGIRDFQHRFGREPEGIWLAETAVDFETLEMLAEYGMRFTILAPRQASRTRKIGALSRRWSDVGEGKIDPKMPYRCKLPSGKSITLFFYDGPISQDLAYGDLLSDGENFSQRLVGAFLEDHHHPQIVHIATDGETYGHHHKNGDMALAYCLDHLEKNKLAAVTVYGEYLEKFPPTHEVEIFENSSWSCIHGVERWNRNCGCNSGMHHGWHQHWREPLRNAMDWLRDAIIPLYEKELATYMHNPWEARDNYIDVILSRSHETVERFLTSHARRALSDDEKVKVLSLFEIQRHTMLMYTSCGWFFDEISGIETLQVMQYAARAIQLTKDFTGVDLESAYIAMLEHAPSNIPEVENGARTFEKYVKPAALDLQRVGAHYAISSLFEESPEAIQNYNYTVKQDLYERLEAGKHRLAVGKAQVRSDITGETQTFSFTVLHLGDHNLNGGIRKFVGDKAFSLMQQHMKAAFAKSDIAEIIRLMDRHFGMHTYSLWHLFRDQQRKVFDQIMSTTLDEIDKSFRQVYEHTYPIMQAMQEMNIAFPKPFGGTIEFILDRDLRSLLEDEELDLEQMGRVVDEITRWSCEIDRTTLSFMASKKINGLMGKISCSSEANRFMQTIIEILDKLAILSLEIDLWEPQNTFFMLREQCYENMKKASSQKDQKITDWLHYFSTLGRYLNIQDSNADTTSDL